MVEYVVFIGGDGSKVKVRQFRKDGRQVIRWKAHDGPLATGYAKGEYSWEPDIEGKGRNLKATAHSNGGEWPEEKAIAMANAIEQAPKFRVYVR